MKRDKVKSKTEESYKVLIETQTKTLKYLNKRVRTQDRELAILRRRASRVTNLLSRIKHKLIDDRFRKYSNKKQIADALERLYNDIVKLENDIDKKGNVWTTKENQEKQ